MDTTGNWKLQRVSWVVSARAGNSSISGTELWEEGKEGAKMLGKREFRAAYIWTGKFQEKT